MVQEVTALREGPDGGIGVSRILIECPREVGNACLFTYIWWLLLCTILFTNTFIHTLSIQKLTKYIITDLHTKYIHTYKIQSYKIQYTDLHTKYSHTKYSHTDLHTLLWKKES